MTGKDKRPEDAAELRRRAEEIARERAARSPENIETQSPEETRRVLHELRVHQIELEMQNEELHRAQVELDAAWAHYFDLYDLAPVGYVTISGAGLILDANLTVATLLGVARGALVRQPISRFILKEDQDTYYLHRKQIFETGEPNACELRMVKKDGTAFYAHLEATTAQDEGGAPVSRVVLSDITERKRAEATKAELEAQNRQLQKAESLGRMAGAIAHHFNNQLYVVTGNLEQAMEDLPRGVTPLENIAEAMKAARRAAEVSGLMLTYLGQTTAKQEPMDICEVCGRSLPLLRATLLETILLEAHFPSPGPTINGNANQIQQVLTNLITNAWESCDGRGSVQLTVKTVSAENIPRSHQYPNDWEPQDTAYACLEVKDSGCGIAEKDIEKLFDPFFTTKFTGRGLGLPVVLGILKAHSGAITVESEPGRGSIFRVFLPVSAEAVTHPPEKAAQAPEIAGGGTVLLVEDEEPVRKTASAMLSRLGFTVLEARDGVEAVAVFHQHRDEIRCVLCDLTMPRINGWKTLTALRDLSPGLPVILASGHDEEQVMAGDHPERPDAFLHKPFSRKELANAIGQVLAQE